MLVNFANCAAHTLVTTHSVIALSAMCICIKLFSRVNYIHRALLLLLSVALRSLTMMIFCRKMCDHTGHNLINADHATREQNDYSLPLTC